MKINGGPWFLLETRRLFYYYSSLTGYNTALDKLLRVIFKAFQVIETPARSLIWMGYLSCHEKLIDPSRTAKYSRIAQFSVAKKTLERRCYSNCRKPWQSSLSYLPKTRSLLADDSQTFEKTAVSLQWRTRHISRVCSHLEESNFRGNGFRTSTI